MAIPINEDPHFDPHRDSEDCEALPVIHARPPSMKQLCDETKFSRKEMKIMYRAFKQSCPTGTVLLSNFKEVYSQFFPQANVDQYAELVFRTFDSDNDGTISFEEFVIGLSVISRGTVLEKLNWIFSLYDVSNRGAVGYNELLQVVRAVYGLLGSNTMPPVSTYHVKQHVKELFQKMDMNNDGEISRQEFVEMCMKNQDLCESLALFDTKL